MGNLNGNALGELIGRVCFILLVALIFALALTFL